MRITSYARLLALTCVVTLYASPSDALPPGSAPTTPTTLTRSITVSRVDEEPRDRRAPSAKELADLRRAVHDEPGKREARVALVRGLLASRDLDGALEAAKDWRAKDAYNLVAVRSLGDVLMERGDKEAAARVYSSIVELLPRDPDAQRAVATLFKQRGDLAAARARLDAASQSRPDDARLLFELADVELRMGEGDKATERFAKIVATDGVSDQIRHPAKQRLALALGERRRAALAAGHTDAGAALAKQIGDLHLKGGVENDIHVYLTWDTDRTDVDLWVTTPSGEKVFYSHREGRGGEELFDDITNGYGPESFTAKKAAPGDYVVEVNYFSAHRSAFPEARGEVVVVTHEGRANEKRTVLPYRLFAEKQTVRVAKVHVGGAR
ncbi:MAG: tetratricopeptide repeat protein [Myxococcales bacterium]|nr:tetratricopeptide repeat protein [Myxococcales bacterium]